jgi:DNA repair photolyase
MTMEASFPGSPAAVPPQDATPLGARCDVCAERAACAPVGRRPDYPSCHRPIRRTRLDRLAELLAACAAPHGLDPRRFDALRALLLERHAVDRGRYSEVFELSASRSRGEEHLFRFSYALPDFREAPGQALSLARAIGSLYGEPALRLFERGLALAEDPAVVLPLLGLEDDGAGRFRAKIYLQFADDAGEQALSLAGRLFGAVGWEERFAGRRLHLIGVDAGPHGLVGAKLYFNASPLRLDEAWLSSSGLFAELRAVGVEALTDALAIHRFASPDDPRGDAPTEIDFGLGSNELPWSMIRALPGFAKARTGGLDALESAYQLGVRRLSIEAASDDKLTSYYILGEHEPETEVITSSRPAAARSAPEIARGPRRLESVIRKMMGPLLHGRPGPSGWQLLSWDAEQGLCFVFARGARFVLVELVARDEALDCYARTRLFNVSARSQFTPDGQLHADERALVDALVRFVRTREGLIVLDTSPTKDRAEVREILVERMLMPEGAGRYYLNPYAGCMIGCPFCYVGPHADFSRRIDGSAPPAWGRWVDVKVNAAEVLREEVAMHAPGLVRMSPILTDPYQPIERRYRVTRQCLEILIAAGFGPTILTRESRVLDDLDLLASGRSAVGFSIPTDDDNLRRVFEPGADTIENRFMALRRAAEAGIATCLVVQPALPMNVERFVERTAPWIKVVRIDRMHFGDRVAPLYAAAGISHAASPAYEEELLGRLHEGFTRAGIPIDERDDLAGMIDALVAPKGGWGGAAP